MSHPPSKPVAYFCLGLSMTMVGCYVALTKPLVAAIPVFLLAWLRFGIAAVAMAPWLRKTGVEVPMPRRPCVPWVSVATSSERCSGP